MFVNGLKWETLLVGWVLGLSIHVLSGRAIVTVW